MDTEQRKKTLSTGITNLGLDLSETAQDKMLSYLLLLEKWNKTHNLTAIKDFETMITHHLLDSLAVASFINKSTEHVLDLGSGAGLPGIPLALNFPEKNFILLDSNNKKVHFLQHVLAVLAINNSTAIQSRAENFSSPNKFDYIVTRAVGSIHVIITMAKHLLASSGAFLIMKGKKPEEEIRELALNCPGLMVTTHRLNVPYLAEHRHLVEIRGNFDE